MTWYQSPDPQHPGRAIGVIGLLIIVGIAIFFGGLSVIRNRDHDQRREIARLVSEIERLSETCPAAEAGEKLVSTVRILGGKNPEALRCIYAATSGYGSSMRSRPAVPGGSS
ncbi:hypothetical protein EBAPG3_010375 [Nitrosospira lacus]|uniref:Uncharacterized protein n=1 Tax=Nitrosospira lacus TaxID=1288494 RepID=A0A1W6SQR5_9PROT|nr:hypothetical protein [Nitrosospira lacus]ARO88147.1 hypothetical protein EBAPG3_010375 [Nitrosospira lacus]